MSSSDEKDTHIIKCELRVLVPGWFMTDARASIKPLSHTTDISSRGDVRVRRDLIEQRAIGFVAAQRVDEALQLLQFLLDDSSFHPLPDLVRVRLVTLHARCLMRVRRFVEAADIWLHLPLEHAPRELYAWQALGRCYTQRRIQLHNRPSLIAASPTVVGSAAVEDSAIIDAALLAVHAFRIQAALNMQNPLSWFELGTALREAARVIGASDAVCLRWQALVCFVVSAYQSETGQHAAYQLVTMQQTFSVRRARVIHAQSVSNLRECICDAGTDRNRVEAELERLCIGERMTSTKSCPVALGAGITNEDDSMAGTLLLYDVIEPIVHDALGAIDASVSFETADLQSLPPCFPMKGQRFDAAQWRKDALSPCDTSNGSVVWFMATCLSTTVRDSLLRAKRRDRRITADDADDAGFEDESMPAESPVHATVS